MQKDLSGFEKLRALYTSPLLGGDGDHQLGTIGFFNLITDWDFAERILRKGPVNLELMKKLLPTIGRAVLIQSYIRTVPGLSRSSFRLLPKRNSADELLVVQFLENFTFLRITEALYNTYDINHDRLLSMEETSQILSDMAPGVASDRIIKAFYIDADPNRSGKSLKNIKKLVTHLGTTKLSPVQFVTRLEKFFPWFVKLNSSPGDPAVSQ